MTIKTVLDRRGYLISVVAGAALVLSGCSGDKREQEGKRHEKVELPEYYPGGYDEMVRDAENEGRLLIYSNVAEYNWRNLIEEFHARHPKIRIETLDLGPAEAFERYYAETSAGKRSADMIVVAAPDAWQRFIASGGVAEYDSPESGHLPDWSKPSPGVYTLATDPMILIYNKALLKESEYPKSLDNLVSMAKSDPARWTNKITTYDASSHPFAYSLHWRAVQKMGWDNLETLAAYTRPESGGSTMLDKVMGGEYLAAFYTSGITVFPRMNDAGRDRILGWSLPADGVPVMMRGMAVTKTAKSPNTARVFMDFMLSHDGQVAAGEGGMTPYRPDVDASEVPFLTYSAMADQIGGEEKLTIIGYEPKMLTDYDGFITRWNKLFTKSQ